MVAGNFSNPYATVLKPNWIINLTLGQAILASTLGWGIENNLNSIRAVDYV